MQKSYTNGHQIGLWFQFVATKASPHHIRQSSCPGYSSLFHATEEYTGEGRVTKKRGHQKTKGLQQVTIQETTVKLQRICT